MTDQALVLESGAVVIYQEFDPDLPGSESMDFDAATQKGNEVLGRLL